MATLNQRERSPLPIEDQVVSVFSATNGFLDRINTDRVPDFLDGLMQRMHSEHEDQLEQLRAGDWDDSMESELGDAIAEAIDDFGPDFDEEGNPLEEGESDRVRERRDDDEDSDEDEGDEGDDDSGERGDEEREEAGATA